MKIRIQGFRCYEDMSFTAESRKMSNLAGVSGAGKSTVFSAIYWCLFGSLRNIYNNAKKFKKTAVTLDLPDIVIYRQAKPGLLKVNYQGKEYMDKSAQEIINQMFGSDLVWRCTSYLAQNERNVLLVGNTGDKMDLLSKLSFNEEDIESYVELIEESISEVESKIKSDQCTLSKNYDHLDNADWESYVPIQDRKDFIDALEQLSTLIPETQARIEKNLGVQGKKDSLQESIDSLDAQILHAQNWMSTRDPESLRDSIESVTVQLRHAADYTAQKKRFDEYQRVKAKFDPNLQSFLVDQQTITKSKLLESEIQKHKATCTAHGVNYDSVALQTKIAQVQKVLDDIPLLIKLAGYKKHLAELSTLPPPDQTPEQLQELLMALKSEIKSLDQNILKCPHCTFGVLYCNGVLFKSSVAAEKKLQLPALKAQLVSTESRLTACNLYFAVTDRLEGYKPEDYKGITETRIVPTQKDVAVLHTTLSALKSIKVLKDPEFPSELLIKVYENNLLKSKMSDLQTEDPGPGGNTVSQADLLRLKTELKEYESKESLLDSFWLCRTATETKIEDMKGEEDPGLEPFLVTYKEQFETVKSQLSSWVILDKLQDKKSQLDQLKYNIETNTTLLKSLQDLKRIALELECEILQSTINKINAFLNSLLRPLFDDPISIKLKVSRSTSKKGRTKPKLELQIMFKGWESDCLNDFSGGEGDRVSLALTLALNKMSGSPFMLLDETMTSLNADLQMKCLETMKESTNKTMLSIDHEAIAGFYDCTIQIVGLSEVVQG